MSVQTSVQALAGTARTLRKRPRRDRPSMNSGQYSLETGLQDKGYSSIGPSLLGIDHQRKHYTTMHRCQQRKNQNRNSRMMQRFHLSTNPQRSLRNSIRPTMGYLYQRSSLNTRSQTMPNNIPRRSLDMRLMTSRCCCQRMSQRHKVDTTYHRQYSDIDPERTLCMESFRWLNIALKSIEDSWMRKRTQELKERMIMHRSTNIGQPDTLSNFLQDSKGR